MIKHEFTEDGIKRMYQKAVDDCFKALRDGNLDDLSIKIQIGKHEIEIPIDADNIDILFSAIEDCEAS